MAFLQFINIFELKNVSVIINIKGSKYSCIKGVVIIETRKKYNKIMLFFKFLSIKINIISHEIKKAKQTNISLKIKLSPNKIKENLCIKPFPMVISILRGFWFKKIDKIKKYKI